MQKTTSFKRLLLIALVVFTMAFAVTPLVSAAEGETAGEANPLTPLGINGGLLFAHTFNFIVVVGLLTALMWRPAVNMLDARTAKIQKGLEDAAAAAKARQNAEAEAEKILAEARAQANKLLEEARQRGEETAKAIEAQARLDADKTRQDAQAETVTLRDKELSSLRDQVVSISVAMAGRIIGENIDAKKQSSLVSDFLTKLPEGAKALGGKVEVVSAMPLSEAEQGKVKGELGASEVTFSVDPSILGGLVVRGADRVVDGSVKSSLGALSARLN